MQHHNVSSYHERVLKAGEFSPATYEEAYSAFCAAAEEFGQGPEDFAAFTGAIFMSGLTDLLSSWSRICEGNADLSRLLLSKALPPSDPSAPSMHRHAAAAVGLVQRLFEDLWAHEAQGRLDALAEVHDELARGFDEILTYGMEGEGEGNA